MSNWVVEQIKDILNGSAIIDRDPNSANHYGKGHLDGGHSGRYPWGSGGDPYQHSVDFLGEIEGLKKSGFTWVDEEGKVYFGEEAIRRSKHMSTGDYIDAKKICKEYRDTSDYSRMKKMKDEGLGYSEIAKEMGLPYSTVASRMDAYEKTRERQVIPTANYLKEVIAEKGPIDIGPGVELELGITTERLRQARKILESEGYIYYVGGMPQVTNKGQQTNTAVLFPPGSKESGADFYKFQNGEINIYSVRDYNKISRDGGENYEKRWEYPASLDPKRLEIRYSEDGGTERDGLIELRRGVPDISLGQSHFSQVRILVNDTHYIKGMAVYSDDLPPGIDIRFNTNKSKGTPVLGPKDNSVLKPVKMVKDENGNKVVDKDNPFGSLIKEGVYDPKNPNSDIHSGQSYYYDKNGNRKLSLINKRSDEGDWGEWADKLPSQFLAKQNLKLVKRQLDISMAEKMNEYNDICKLTNPVVKRALLRSFSDDCDSAAVKLQAAPLPRQKYQVILPHPNMRDNEVYAPQFRNGERIALVRFPHEGTYQIPILTVNNNHPDAKKMIGQAKDAVVINAKVAERLSGADFDGDTVLAIPTNNDIRITNHKPLKDLEGFDSKLEYKIPVGDTTTKRMKDTQKQMGMISNLIMDMTIKGATEEELARATKHAMVVIDAEKHELDYKRSEKENRILELKKDYQGYYDDKGNYHSGASTLLTRAKGQYSVPKRQGSAIIDPETGKISYKTKTKLVRDPATGKYKEVDDLYYTDKKGKLRMRTQQSTQMAETDDAFKLSSGHPVENLYAEYANYFKNLGNTARKEMVSTKNIPYSSDAAKRYSSEVSSLEHKLALAERNAPRERMAQREANAIVASKKSLYKQLDMTDKEMKSQLKKDAQKAIVASRAKYGAKRYPVEIDDKEWEAIQSGAIHTSMLEKIVKNADIDILRQKAMPRATTELSVAKQNRIAAMYANGRTQGDIAKALGVSVSTVNKYIH